MGQTPMTLKQAQEGIAEEFKETRHSVIDYCGECIYAEDSDIEELTDRILSLLFTPEAIEEWKKGGYPAIVCKNQKLLQYPASLRWSEYAEDIQKDMLEFGFLKCVKGVK